MGQHVVEQLIDAGERNIRVLASRVPDRMKDAGVEAVEGTILNKDDVARAVNGASVILHLAGKVSRDEQDAAEMNLVHLQGTRLLSEAAVEAKLTNREGKELAPLPLAKGGPPGVARILLPLAGLAPSTYSVRVQVTTGTNSGAQAVAFTVSQ